VCVVPALVCGSDGAFRIQFLTFSVEHLGDVQELLGHLESRVQVPDGVVLQTHTITVRHTPLQSDTHHYCQTHTITVRHCLKNAL